MADRVPCRNPECSRTILPSTAAETGGLCMPCVQAAARKERAEYIRQNCRDVNEFVGVEDPVEALKIIHRPRKFDPLINWIPHPAATDQLYAGLNSRDISRLLEYVASLLGSARNEESEAIVLCLAAFTDADLDECLRAFVSRNSFWPSLPFHRSSPELRDELIERLGKDQGNRNHILLALAWIGDPRVVELFASWKRHPPSWAGSLHIPPQDYSLQAGWEVTDDGQKRQLYFDACTKLVRGTSSSPGSFRAIIDREGVCPWCGAQLTDLFDITPGALGLSGEVGLGAHFQVPTCQICTAFGVVFGVVDGSGTGHWSSANSRPAHLPGDTATWGRLPQDSLSPGGKRAPLFAADQFLPTTFSQVGGHPTWIQDADYPQCPECTKTMMFLAQLSHDEIEEHSEGIYYSFICPSCRTTATNYQQT
jgi:hypothetical protein